MCRGDALDRVVGVPVVQCGALSTSDKPHPPSTLTLTHRLEPFRKCLFLFMPLLRASRDTKNPGSCGLEPLVGQRRLQHLNRTTGLVWPLAAYGKLSGLDQEGIKDSEPGPQIDL